MTDDDNLKFVMTPEQAKFMAHSIREGNDMALPKTDALVENLLNLFNGENQADIVIALTIVIAIMDNHSRKDGRTSAAREEISIADVLRLGVPIYKMKLRAMDASEAVH